MSGAPVLTAVRSRLPRILAVSSGRCSAPVKSVLPPAPCVPSPPWTASSLRTLQLCSALCAGHNKWSKVKNIKGPKDEARAKMFLKYAMMIKVAVKEGGSNPDTNVNLAHILEQCRSKNMPKASVEAAIKGVEKNKPLSQHMLEAWGPGGCVLLIDVLTDSHAQAYQDIKRLLKKNGGMLSEGLRHKFTTRGVVAVAVGAADNTISMERALELAIEAGAEDVLEAEDEEEQPVLQFMCETTDLNKVRASLKKLGMEITSSGLEFVPRTFTSLDQSHLNAASTLIEALNDYPDVVRVWDNIQADG